jgi:hypothetical protein
VLPIVVLKFGSSVLSGPRNLPGAVDEVYRRLRLGSRVLAVASAFAGETDRLIERAAIALGKTAAPEAVAAYVATREIQSAALLTGHCCTRVSRPVWWTRARSNCAFRATRWNRTRCLLIRMCCVRCGKSTRRLCCPGFSASIPGGAWRSLVAVGRICPRCILHIRSRPIVI